MTEKEMRREIVNIIQGCLHENNQSIRFTTNINQIFRETNKFYTKAKFEVFVHFTDEKQKKVLERKLQAYASKSHVITRQKDVYTWYFIMTT